MSQSESDRREAAEAGSDGTRTFLIADIRGYTAFTQGRGDEWGARLAQKFACIMREGVEAVGGDVLELRGDEALCVCSGRREGAPRGGRAPARLR
jgi:class 3 adenylate cyclase